MSNEISSTIIKKAREHHPNKLNLEQIGAVYTITQKLSELMKTEIHGLRKLFLFDLDNTLVQGKFIDECAKKFSFEKELAKLRKTEKDPTSLTKRTAILLKGLTVSEVESVVKEMPVVEDAKEIITRLKKQGNVVGIVSDGYQLVADIIKTKINADFALANQLSFFEGKITGDISIPSFFYYQLESKCQHALCKTNALLHIAHKYDIPIENCIAIGDAAEDLCMIEKAGMGIAFCSKNKQLKTAADYTIDDHSFSLLLKNELVPPRKKISELVI